METLLLSKFILRTDSWVGISDVSCIAALRRARIVEIAYYFAFMVTLISFLGGIWELQQSG